MENYMVEFDNLVTDEVIVKTYKAKSFEECFVKAYIDSKQTGLSEGNFEMYRVDRDKYGFIKLVHEYEELQITM